jgi:hypothetical protein
MIAEWVQHMLHPSRTDLITAIFDTIFVCAGIENLRKLIKDKEVKGFDWKNMCLFLGWNVWSTFVVYPSASFYLANVINFIYMLTQITWLTLFFKYRNAE